MSNNIAPTAAYVSISEDKGSTISVVREGEVLEIRSENKAFNAAFEAYKAKAWDKFYAIISPAIAIKKAFQKHGSVVINDGTVTFEGNEVNNVVVERILQFVEDGLDVAPLSKFLERLLANPSQRAVTELYKFLEHENLPITDEGFFVAYKGIALDYKDIYTHTIDNSVGKTVQVKREEVDHDKDKTCSYGLHAGSLEYATQYGSSGRVVLVEIDPADVVSIPSDYNGQKLRTCKYKVIADYKGALRNTLYTTPENADIDQGDYYDEDEDDTTPLTVTVEDVEVEDLTVFFGFAVGRALNGIEDYADRAATLAKLRWLRSAILAYTDGDEDDGELYVVDNSFEFGLEDVDDLIETLVDDVENDEYTLTVPDFVV